MQEGVCNIVAKIYIICSIKMSVIKIFTHPVI